MISASKAFKEKLKKGANVVNYADFTLSDGAVLHLEPKDFMIGGCQIEDKTTDGKFGVGFAIGKTLTLRIANHDERFSRYDFYGSIINLYVALKLDNGTIEKIRKGVYYTIVPETPGDIIEISAVDGMFKLDRDYSASKTTYPATLQRIISDACLDCGIPIGFRQFDNMSYTVKEKPEQETYRQIVSYACQIAGYNARIDNNGSMQLVWYNTSLLDAYNYKGGNFHNYPHDTVVNGGNFTNYGTNTILSGGSFTDAMPEHIFKTKSVNIHTDDVQITGVRVSGQEEVAALFGEEGYLIEVKENPFSNGNEQAVANYLGARMVGMVFRPFSAEVLNNPLYEPFDVVRVSDVKGNVYYSLLNSISYKIGAYTTVACEAEDPVRNGSEYVSAAAQAVVEARRNTEKQLTTYDKAVQNMNQLTANAMGLFTASEKTSDGGSIFYQSTKPITKDSNGKCHFEAGSTVYKKQGEGFFVSRDGGKTYSSGFDADGNAVLNVLYAIGIVCDWIRGGTLTLGGKGNSRGLMEVYDESGNLCGTIDAKIGMQMMKYISSNNIYMVNIKEVEYYDTTDKKKSRYGLCVNHPTPTPEKPYQPNGLSWGRISLVPSALFEYSNLIESVGRCDFSLRHRSKDEAFVPEKYLDFSGSYQENSKHSASFGIRKCMRMESDPNAYYNITRAITITWTPSTDKSGVGISTENLSVGLADKDTTISLCHSMRNLHLKGAVSETTTYSANVRWGTSYGEMMIESSSSRRYKDIEREMSEEDIKNYYLIKPVIARYKEGYLNGSDARNGMYYPMFIAENIEEVIPEAVEYNEEGLVENWNHRVMIPAMFQMIKSQKETIDNQQAEIESLTERVERLEALLLKGDE